jgi:hypothetical protein
MASTGPSRTIQICSPRIPTRGGKHTHTEEVLEYG